ncbi:MAG: glycosyltransferase [Pseudomonadota bacterium]
MARSAPLISVLMPVHNGGAYLADAVESILAQTCANFEFLIVDDASDDGALDALPHDSRITFMPSHGRGIVPALNTGLTAAQGEFVARMDADDLALPERFQAQLDHFQMHPELGILGTQVELFGNEGVTEGYRRYQQWVNALTTATQIAHSIYIESPIPHPTAMVRRRLFESLGGYRDTPWPEDYDLWLRAHLAGVHMGKPDGILLRWRDHGARLSRCDERYAVDQFVEAKADALALSQLRNRAAIICGTGRQAVQLHRALDKRKISITHFVDVDPRRIGGTKCGRPVIGIDHVASISRDALLLGAVGAWNARERLRDFFLAQDFRESVDFLMLA